MSKFKEFDIKKAEEVSLPYEIRYTFISILISAQKNSINKSIVGSEIRLLNYFAKDIVEQLLNELGYTLTFYKFGIECGIGWCRQVTTISFVPQESDSTEGN